MQNKFGVNMMDKTQMNYQKHNFYNYSKSDLNLRWNWLNF